MESLFVVLAGRAPWRILESQEGVKLWSIINEVRIQFPPSHFHFEQLSAHASPNIRIERVSFCFESTGIIEPAQYELRAMTRQNISHSPVMVDRCHEENGLSNLCRARLMSFKYLVST